MEMMLALVVLGLSCVVGVVNLACVIVFLIELFKAKGPAHGIFGICCGVYTLIWAVQNHAQLDASNPPRLGLRYQHWLWIWGACMLVSLGLQAVSALLESGAS